MYNLQECTILLIRYQAPTLKRLRLSSLLPAVSPSSRSASSCSSTQSTGEPSPRSLCAQSFYLCLSCLGQSLYVILLNPITIRQIQEKKISGVTGYCVFEATLKCYFDLSSIIWTSLIIYSVYASVVRKNSMESYEVIYLILAFVVPLIAAIIPIFLNLYGYDQYFCWFAADRVTEFWLKMGYFFIPLWVLFIFNLTLSQVTYRNLKKLELDPRQLMIFKRLMLFPFIMLVTGLFATADIIANYVKGKYVVWLDNTGVILLSFYGFFTAIAYGFNPIIREKIESFLCAKKQTDQINAPRISNTSEMSAMTVRNSSSSNQTERLEKQLFEQQSRRGTRLLN